MAQAQDGGVHLYSCTLTLCEHTYFASREVGTLVETEPVIGNYALTYAMGFALAPYECGGAPSYADQLRPAYERGIYVTPATFVPPIRFVLSEWNAVSDAYWYAFGSNAIVVRPDGGTTTHDEKTKTTWYTIRPDGKRSKVPATNYPQHGRAKMLARGNRAVYYVFSSDPVSLPRYIRLGKWASKARVDVEHTYARPEMRVGERLPVLLNPADFPEPYKLSMFDVISVHPVPLVHNVVMSGPAVRAPDGHWLPSGMRFGPVVHTQ